MSTNNTTEAAAPAPAAPLQPSPPRPEAQPQQQQGTTKGKKMFSSLKDLVSNTLDHLDDLTTIDEKKWLERAKKGMDTLKEGVDNLTTTLNVEPVKLKPRPLDLSAGGDLLHKYDVEWTRIYRQHLDVIHNTKVIDLRIRRITKSCEEELASWERLQAQLVSLPQISEAVLRTSALIGEVSQQCEALEQLFVQFDMDAEAADLEHFTQQQTANFEEHCALRRRDVKAHEFLVKKAKDDVERAKMQRVIAQQEHEKLEREESVSLIKEKILTQLHAIALLSPERKPRSSSTHEEDAASLAQVVLDVPRPEQEALDSFLDQPPAAAPVAEAPSEDPMSPPAVPISNVVDDVPEADRPTTPEPVPVTEAEAPAQAVPSSESKEEQSAEAQPEPPADAPAEEQATSAAAEPEAPKSQPAGKGQQGKQQGGQRGGKQGGRGGKRK